MKVTDIIAKLMKGEALTEEEKGFLQSYDPQKELDAAASAARRKAEAAAKEATDKLTAQNATLAELQEKLDAASKKGQGENAEITKLQKRLASLEAINAANEAKIKATTRAEAIRNAAKAAGISAAEGVSVAALERLIDLTVGDTDVGDADALNAVLNQFKTDNPAMIAATVKAGTGIKGVPSGDAFRGLANPWKKESFNLTKQIEVSQKNPQLAETMKTEAGVPVK